MRHYTKTAGLIFLAASSVYSYQAIAGTSANGADPATDVKLLESDPFGPTSQPATQPATEGTSVSASEVAVSDAGTVEIHVNDANLVEVLRMLSLQTQKNILPSKEVRGTVTANLYDVTVREALDAILHANGYAYREKGSFIYVYTTKELDDIEKAELRMQTRVFRLNYTPAVNAQTMIKPVLSSLGTAAMTTPALSGLETGATNIGGNDHATEDMLVVTDYPENLDRVASLLAEIDRRPQQILLEATILRATLNDDNALGVDFNVLSGVDLSTVTSNNGQFTGAGTASPLSPSDTVSSVGTGNAFGGSINGGLKVGVVSQNVSVFVSALEQLTDTTVLANPKVLALNKQKGEIFVGNEDGYYTTVTTETTTTQTVESLKTGTRLIFRPYISGDGYIRMEVHPEDSAGEVKANGLPSKSTTEVTSNVMVKDGHTILIGGLFRESSSSARSQIPFLGSIPIAGQLFRSQRDRTVREEVIVMLTPHIVKDDSAFSELSEEAMKMGEQLRVGIRKGMMPWGRERMADTYYEWAQKEMRKPNPNRRTAKWHLDAATNLNPKFVEAIEMKQQITGYEVTTADSSAIRTFVRRMMLEDSAPVTPAATQPATRPAATVSASGATTQPTLSITATTRPSSAVTLAPSTQPVAAKGGTDTTTGDSSVADKVAGWLWGGSKNEESSLEGLPMVEETVTAETESESSVTELPVEEAYEGFESK
jgi:type IV pilus assembly protein PilQ